MAKGYKMVRLTDELHTKLKKVGDMGDTYSDTIQKLYDYYIEQHHGH